MTSSYLVNPNIFLVLLLLVTSHSLTAQDSKEHVRGSDGTEYYIKYDNSMSGLKLTSELIAEGNQNSSETNINQPTIETDEILDPDNLEAEFNQFNDSETIPSAIDSEEYLDPDEQF